MLILSHEVIILYDTSPSPVEVESPDSSIEGCAEDHFSWGTEAHARHSRRVLTKRHKAEPRARIPKLHLRGHRVSNLALTIVYNKAQVVACMLFLPKIPWAAHVFSRKWEIMARTKLET